MGKPLTLLSKSAGCAAKIGPQDLHDLISGLKIRDADTLSSLNQNEDAGAWQLSDRRYLLQSLDVITPVSDNPYVYGGIAVAHALSDLYAKGAQPALGLLMLGIPIFDVTHQIGKEILQGALDKLEEAGAKFMGGHTIGTEQLEVGVAVSGIMDSMPVPNTGCKSGDLLLITKPIGNGIVTTALKLANAQMPVARLTPELVKEAENIMLKLNASASQAMVKVGANACTDISGFGLIGHLMNMLQANNLSAVIDWNKIPILDGVVELAEQMIASSGCDRNAAYWWDECEFDSALSHAQKMILFDPQTSGGLLISTSPETVDYLIDEMHRLDWEICKVIGQVKQKDNRPVTVSA